MFKIVLFAVVILFSCLPPSAIIAQDQQIPDERTPENSNDDVQPPNPGIGGSLDPRVSGLDSVSNEEDEITDIEGGDAIEPGGSDIPFIDDSDASGGTPPGGIPAINFGGEEVFGGVGGGLPSVINHETYIEISIAAGQEEYAVRFEITETDPRLVAVYTFQDHNNDQSRQSNEASAPGVYVQLNRINTRSYNSETYTSLLSYGHTGEYGMLGFGDLPVGSYEIKYPHPAKIGSFNIQPANWFYKRSFFDLETYLDHKRPGFFERLDDILFELRFSPIQPFGIFLIVFIVLGPFIVLLFGFLHLTYSLFFSSSPRLGLNVYQIEIGAERKKIEALKEEDGTFPGVERFEWLHIMEAQFDRLSKEVAGLTSNARTTFGAAIIFIGLSLIWTFVLVYRVFAPTDFGFAQAFALVSPLLIFLGTTAYLLRNTLRARQEVAVARQEMNEIQFTISQAVASIDSKDDFASFLQRLIKSSAHGDEANDKADSAGLADNPRILAAIISALGRSAS